MDKDTLEKTWLSASSVSEKEYEAASKRVKRYQVIIPIGWDIDDNLKIDWTISYECYATNNADAYRMGQLFVHDMTDTLKQSLIRKIDDDIFHCDLDHRGPMVVNEVESHGSYDADDVINGWAVNND